MSVIDLLTNTLKDFNYPVIRQGSLGADEAYPDSFFTFWNFSTPDSSHYDNKPKIADWGIWISFFTNNPDLIYSIPDQVKQKLEVKGFIVTGKGEDAFSDVPTHVGRRITVYFKEKY